MPPSRGENIPAGPALDISSICIFYVVGLVKSVMSLQGLGKLDGLKDTHFKRKGSTFKQIKIQHLNRSGVRRR